MSVRTKLVETLGFKMLILKEKDFQLYKMLWSQKTLFSNTQCTHVTLSRYFKIRMQSKRLLPLLKASQH